MGYTTEFRGQFTLSAEPSAEVIIRLREIEGERGRDVAEDAPRAYNQWVLTKDFRHIRWDGNEKFYDYVEWLQWIIDRVLAPNGLTLSGTVQYQGEDMDDGGVLTIEGHTVRQLKREVVALEFDELKAFAEFVKAHPKGRAVLAAWAKRKRQAGEVEAS